MTQKEYDKIIDKYSVKYEIEFDLYTRKTMVLFHQRMLNPIPFDNLCHEMALELLCRKLKPGMDLYDRVYTLHAQN